MNLAKYTIEEGENLVSALQKIDVNKKGFLVVLKNRKVFGTITDGDIRRALLKGKSLEEKAGAVCTRQFTSITAEDAFEKIVQLFQDERVKFLPVVDKTGGLVNIITKANLHTLLLQNITYDASYPFEKLDDTVLEHEICPRPWGYYKTAFMNRFCQCKMIHIMPKGVLSLQKHLHRKEYWIIVNGQGEVTIDTSVVLAKTGDQFTIPVNTVHRIRNVSETEMLTLTEVQVGDYFGEDDIIRLEDAYGRF